MHRLLNCTVMGLALLASTAARADEATPEPGILAEVSETTTQAPPQALIRRDGEWYYGSEIIGSREMNQVFKDCEPCRRRMAVSKGLAMPGSLIMLTGAVWEAVGAANQNFAQMGQGLGLVFIGCGLVAPASFSATPKRLAAIHNEYYGIEP